MVMELIVTAVLMAVICLLAGIVVLAGLAVWYVLSRILGKIYPQAESSRKRRRWLKLGCILLAFLLAFCYADNPPLVGVPDLEVSVEEMPEDLRTEIIEVNNGLYGRLPLFPIYIEVLEFDGEQALVKTHYFPAGTVEREHGPDGPSITKPLN